MIDGAFERRGLGIPACRAVLVLIAFTLLALSTTRAQEPARSDTGRVSPRVDSLAADTLAVDTLTAADSLASDTLRPQPPATRLLARDIGAPLGAMTPLHEEPGYDFLAKRDLIWRPYFTAFDALAPHLPAYPLSMGGPGLVRAFSYAGSSPSVIGVHYNGRPLRPAATGYDLELYPMEFIERVEILRGASAAIFGNGESLIALNFVEPRYDVEGSYTRLWYTQGPNNTSGADITYSRNVARRANVALGFRRLASDGVYTQRNQDVSGWSGRGAVRWDISEKLVVSITELFSDATRGLSGGLLDSSSASPLLAEVANDSLDERTFRHDMTLATRWYPLSRSVDAGDTSGAPGVDTTFRIDGSLYVTYVERTLKVADRPAMIAGVATESSTSTMGARLGVRLPLAFARLLANGFIEYGDDERLRFEAGGLLELPVADVVMARGGVKLQTYGDDVRFTAAGDGAIRLGDSLTLLGSVRTTQRLSSVECPLVPLPGGYDSLLALSVHHTGFLAEAAGEWRSGAMRLRFGGFLRTAVPAECSGFESYSITGADATLAIPISFLTLDNHLIATFPGGTYKGFPLLYGMSALNARFDLFGGNLNLLLGTSLEYQTSTTNVVYDNVSGDFLIPKADERSSAPPFPVWSAYAHGRIGTAFLRVEMRNILDVEFATLRRYPTFGRGVYLSVNWALVD